MPRSNPAREDLGSPADDIFMRSSVFTLSLVLVLVALGGRLCARQASPQPAGVGTLYCKFQDDRLQVTLHNSGTESLVYRTRQFNDEPPVGTDVDIRLETEDGVYIAPMRGCGTGQRFGSFELPPGESINWEFVRHPSVALEAQIPVSTVGPVVAKVEVITPAGLQTVRSQPCILPLR